MYKRPTMRDHRLAGECKRGFFIPADPGARAERALPLLVRCVAICILFVVVSSCGGGSGLDSKSLDVARGTLDEITTATYPNYGAVVISDRMMHTYEFWKTKIERRRVVKILTAEGIESFGDVVSPVLPKKYVDYDLEVAIEKPDGSVTKVTRNQSHQIEIGKHYIQYRLALPGLEPGCVVNFYDKTELDRGKKSGRWAFAADVPTLESELVFKVPAGVRVDFNFTPQSSAVAMTPTPKDRFQVYTIRKENVPPCPVEPYMPLAKRNTPHVYYYVWQESIANVFAFLGLEYDPRMHDGRNIPYAFHTDWKQLGGIYAGYFDPSTWREADDADEYERAFEEVVQSIAVPEDSDVRVVLDAILHELGQRLHVIESAYAFRFENPNAVWKDKEGTPFEVAYACRQMLKRFGFWSTVVLVRDADDGLIDKRSPDPFALTHPLLLLESGSERHWIDPVNREARVDQLPWEAQGVTGLAVKDKDHISWVMTPVDGPEKNTITRWENVQLTASGSIMGLATATMAGQYLVNARRAADGSSIDASNEYLLSVLQNNPVARYEPGSLKIESETRDSLRVSFEYRIDDFADQAGGYLSVDFSAWCDIVFDRAFQSDERRYNVELPFPATCVTSVTFRLPEGYTVFEPIKNARQKTEHVDYRRMAYQEGNTLVFARKLALNSVLIDKAEYTATKRVMDVVRSTDRESLVLTTQ